jgi:hypothetical protein
MMYCKNFCKCHNVPQPSTPIKNKKNKNKNSSGGPDFEWYFAKPEFRGLYVSK